MMTDETTACGCGGSDGCGWISHLDGRACSHSFTGSTAPLGWQRTSDAALYFCPSCAFIRSVRERGPFTPAPVKHRARVLSEALPH